MGFFKDLAESWRARHAENSVREAGAKRIAQILEMAREDEQDEWQKVVEKNLGRPAKFAGDLTESDSVVVNTRSDGIGWEILGSAFKGHIGQDQQVMIAQARRMFRFDPNAQASIYGLLDYLMGHGLTITPKSKDERIWKLWRKFWTDPSNKMGIRQFECVKRWARDGELLLRFFTKDQEKNQTPFTTVRFLDPIDLRRGAAEANDITDKTAQGIIFDPEDAEKPLQYFFRKRNKPQEEMVVNAADVLHVKFPVADMDQPRGESSMQAVMDLFTHYKQWLKNRIILNKLRTAIFAVRKIDIQSGAAVSSLAQSLPASARSTGGDSKKMNVKPGTLYTPPPGVDIEMRSPNINASDVKEDGRNIKLEMSAGTRLPEFMYGDASNANYSSTMMAESPFVKHIHFLQCYLEETLWKPLFRKVIETAVAAGKLTPPKEEDIFAEPGKQDLSEAFASANGNGADTKKKPDDKKKKEPKGEPISESEEEIFYGCDIEWPEIIHREPKEQAESLVLARNEGWVSDKTASEKLGYDYAEEVRKQQQIEDEAEEAGNPLLDRAAGDMNALDEEGQGLNQQKKEEAMAAGGNKKASAGEGE